MNVFYLVGKKKPSASSSAATATPDGSLSQPTTPRTSLTATEISTTVMTTAPVPVRVFATSQELALPTPAGSGGVLGGTGASGDGGVGDIVKITTPKPDGGQFVSVVLCVVFARVFVDLSAVCMEV